MGESVAPFRLLQTALAVVPWEESGRRLLDAKAAQESGYMYLANWLNRAEQLWTQHGRGNMSFIGQIDYYGKLSAQFPLTGLRMVYSKSGSLLSATLLTDNRGLIDHTLYSHTVDSESEGNYLVAILNSETARQRAEHL